MIDSRFAYPEPPVKRDVWKQALQNAETISILPINKSDTLYEFELPGRQAVYLFGPRSGFKVKAVLECKAEAEADDKYDKIPAADFASFLLQPNWFQNLFKGTEVFHNNTSIKNHDVPRYADAWLDTYLNSVMDEDIKRCLYPEPGNPGNCVPTKKHQWNSFVDYEWHNYSKQVLDKSSLTFRYIPPHTFPFYQQTNFGIDGEPAALPMSILNKITFTLQFKDNFDCVYSKTAANTKKYRIRIESIELVVQEARLNPAFERAYLSRTKPLYYRGLTKFALVENIPTGVLQHRTQFPNIEMPEGIFMFALNKSVTGGEFKYSSIPALDTSKSIFKTHNIDIVDITYKDMPLAIKTPNLGTVRDHMIEIGQYMDHMFNPPFGVLQNIKNLSFDDIKEGGEESLFPHVYINLCPSGKNTRYAGHGEDGKNSTKPGNLDLNIRFRGEGSVADATYFIYIFYSDYTVVLDYRDKQIYTYYKKSRPNI